jgi:uncharacterized Zn-finger protein
MSEFKCSGCNYISSQKNNVLTHINKRVSCSNHPIVIETVKTIACSYCLKEFTLKQSIIRHLQICKLKNKLSNKIIKLERV